MRSGGAGEEAAAGGGGGDYDIMIWVTLDEGEGGFISLLSLLPSYDCEIYDERFAYLLF